MTAKLKKCLYIINLLNRRGPLSLEEINRHFGFSTLYDGEDIHPRTFARYKDFIAETFPCQIEYDPGLRKYRIIQDEQIEPLYDYLLSAYHIEGLSELALKHHDKIFLMSAPTGIENVQTVLEAIDRKKGIECDYWAYNKKTKKHQIIIPYFLKTWEQRWYLVAEPDNHHHGQSVFALERMDNLTLTEAEMRPSSDITVKEYFDGSFGVNHSDTDKPEIIRIKVYGTQVDYVRALPLHESQVEVGATNDWSIFEYRIIPCYNFYQQLLWHREKLEVLGPDNVRAEMVKIVKDLVELYK